MSQDTMDKKQILLPWLTGEVALYGLILCLALAIRLVGPNIRIMDGVEAEQAWQAWQLAHGQAPTGSYSPVLLAGQALLFSLFGSGDGAARLWPALAGSLVVVLPFFLRSYLGRIGSLVAALAMAVSPTLVYSSRYGDGAMLLVASSFAVAVLWLAYRESRRVHYLYTIAILGAVAALADPRVIGVFLALVAAWAVERLVFARDVTALDASIGPISWRGRGLTFGAALLLGATALAFNPGGLGAWADFPSAWARHLSPVVNGQPWYYPLLALVLYEPFLLFFGAIGAWDLLVRRERGTFFVWLALGLLIVAMLAGGRNAGDVALVCVPLALLAGRAANSLAQSWRQEGQLAREGLFALVLLAILVFVSFNASFYAFSLYRDLPQALRFFWFWLLAVSVLIILIGMSLAWFGTGVTWRACGAVIALALLSSAFSATTGLNFRHANDPRELHVRSAFVEGTRDALEVISDISYHQWNSPTAMPVTVEARLGPVWRWYLRDWEDVTFVQELSPDVATPMVVTGADQRLPEIGGGLDSSDRYIGQDFVVSKWWERGQLDSRDQLSWWLYRQSLVKPMPLDKVIVWTRFETGE